MLSTLSSVCIDLLATNRRRLAGPVLATTLVGKSMTWLASNLLSAHSINLSTLLGRLLSRSLFGKSAERFGERLLLIPCLEGIEEGRIPHYHCTIGVDESRLDVTTAKIRQSWAQTRFCGHHNEVTLYRDEGWLGYNTKRCMFPKKEVIDWENVIVPTSSQSILG